MKKLILLAIATLIGGVAFVNAGQRKYGAPESEDGIIAQSWAYSGVSRSTVALSSANVLCFTGEGIAVGFIASSNTSITDYMSFRDTASLVVGAVSGGNSSLDDFSTGQEFARVYLSTTNNVDTQSIRYGTSYLFPAPIRVFNGLVVKANIGTVNMITVLFHKFGKDRPESLNP